MLMVLCIFCCLGIVKCKTGHTIKITVLQQIKKRTQVYVLNSYYALANLLTICSLECNELCYYKTFLLIIIATSNKKLCALKVI